MRSPSRRRPRSAILTFGMVSLLGAACSGGPNGRTLAHLRNVEPDLTEVEVTDGIDQAMLGYRRFLEEAPKSSLTPEAMRRLADLKLEKEYGILGDSDRESVPGAQLPEPTRATPKALESGADRRRQAALGEATPNESAQAFEERLSRESLGGLSADDSALELPGDRNASDAGPLEAIALYDEILAAYPNYPNNDQVLYQKARAYDELGRVDEAIAVAAQLVAEYPESRHLDEIQFRRAEYFFTRKKLIDAEEAYSAIVVKGPQSDYYELALYKLGWTLYKQMLLEEALDQYTALLDYKASTGYDFDQVDDEADAQRIADTYRVMSLCFSDLGGAESIRSYFSEKGGRDYEDRVYQNLGEFYLEKRRYADAADVYETFVGLHPIHRASPHFSMRVVEIYEAGQFPKLVLESKKNFASRYGLDSDYWSHFEVAASSEVLGYLKGNLTDLANHYHALYQSTARVEDKPAHFAESTLWYREYIKSFPEDPETPELNYQLADLLLENQNFDTAADEYERVAYGYAPHERASAAGYAAIFAHRENHESADEEAREPILRETVESTLRFVERFAEHEQSATVLGAAVDDLYALADFETAIATGHRLLGAYPDAKLEVRRGAWTIIAHASFDTEAFESAENAYAEVLELTEPEDESADDVRNNLAAAIYKQGEQAKARDEFEEAAQHFLRIAEAAPDSDIRPIAEYDAAAALIHLESWKVAATTLESFRSSFPEHELQQEATRQLAFVYREEGSFARAAEEYERVAAEATAPELRGEALLVAGELYESAQMLDRALAAFRQFVTDFTRPIEPAVVTRFKMAELYEQMGDSKNHRAELRAIVQIDAQAGDERTDAVRVVAAKSALALSESEYESFADIELTQPFAASLQAKQKQMNATLGAFGRLVDYEVGEVTAAATFYMAEVYGEFSRALLESERPSDLASGELLDYEDVLEEEAYPFEEKAIEVHQKNLELMAAGVFNRWIEKSLERLAVAMPGRYAKFEASSGFVESVESYVYRKPNVAIAAVVAEATDGPTTPSDTTAPAPTAGEIVGSPEPEALELESDAPVPASPSPDISAPDDSTDSTGDTTAHSEGMSDDEST